MAEDLIIKIGADTQDFNAELIASQNQLRKFQTELKNATDPSVVTNLQSKISELKTKIDSLQTSNANFVKGTNQARFALNDLSRVAQDAPYGFIGISNNINPLIDSFARLKQETGTTKGAFKALASELGGIGGLGLVVGVVTSAITLMDIGLTRWTGSAKLAKEKTDELKKSQEEFSKSLNSVKSGALSSAIQLQSFVDIAKNGNLPLTQRNQALENANKILGDYGQKLTLANIATAEGRKETELYTKAIIAQAVANKYADNIADLKIKETNLNKKLAISSAELSKATKEYERTKKAADEAARAGAYTANFGADAYNKLREAQLKVNGIQLDLKNTTTLINSSQKELTSSTLESTKAFADLGTKQEETKKSLDTISGDYKKFLSDISKQNELDLIFGKSTLSNLEAQFKIIQSTIEHLIKQHNDSPQRQKVLVDLELRMDQIRSAMRVEKIRLGVGQVKFEKIDVSEVEKQLDKEFEELKKRYKISKKIDVPFKWQFPDILKGDVFSKSQVDIGAGFLDYFSKLGTDSLDAFTEAISKGGKISTIASNFFQGLFVSLGKNLEELGKYMVAAGIKLLMIKKAMIANPAFAIAGGIALAALGALISANLAKKEAFAVGTRNAPGGMALVGERGPEMVSLPQGAKVTPAAQTSAMMGAMQSVEVYGVLKGQDIYFSNKKYAQTYNRTA